MPGSGPAKRGRGRIIEEDQLSTTLAAKINANANGKAIEEEGNPLTDQPTLNFIGTGVTATDDGENDRTNVTIPGGTGHAIEDEGSPITDRPILNFVGAGVVASDDGEKTVVTVAGGGGGLARIDVANPFTDHYLYDEFYYPTSSQLDNHYVKNGTFSVPSQVVSGQVRFTVSTTGVITHIRTCGGGLSAIEADKKFRFVVRAKLSNNVLHAQLINLFVDGGQLPAGSYPFGTNPNPYIQFFLDAGNNWIARTHNGSTPNSTDTAVAADLLMHTFEIISDPAVPNIVFKIDDVIVATFTTNLPTGLMTMYIGNQAGENSAKNMDVDTMFLFNER